MYSYFSLALVSNAGVNVEIDLNEPSLFFAVIWGLGIPKAGPDRVFHCGATWHNVFYCGHSKCCPEQACGSLQLFFLSFFVCLVTLLISVDLHHMHIFHVIIRHWLSPLSDLDQTEGSSETTEKLKKGISGFLGVISETLAPPPDKTIDCDVITLMATPTGTTEVYDSSKVTLMFLDMDQTLVVSVV